MKLPQFAIFKKVSQTAQYQYAKLRETLGYECISVTDDESDFINKVTSIELNNCFSQKDGIILDQNGAEVFDSAYPDYFDFGDYEYHLEELWEIDNEAQLEAIIRKLIIDNQLGNPITTAHSDNNTHLSIKLYEPTIDMTFWVDVTKNEYADFIMDWNQFIFFTHVPEDKFRKIYQNNLHIFEQVFFKVEEYIYQNELENHHSLGISSKKKIKKL